MGTVQYGAMHSTPRQPGPRQLAASILIFLALSIAYLHPAILHLKTSTPGLGLNYTLMANSMFINEQLGKLSWPVTIDRIFYPSGYAIHEGLVPGLIVWLLGGWSDPLVGLNLSLFASFWLAALGAYLLAFQLTRSQFGSLVAGMYFGFCAQHLSNIGSYPVFHLQWLPWFLWSLLQAREGSRRFYCPLVGLFFALASLSSWYFGVFLVLATSLFGLVELTRTDRDWRLLVQIGGTLLVTTVLLVPLTPAFLLGRAGVDAGGFKYVVDGSADLLSFFVPARHHWLWGGQASAIKEDWLGNPSLQANFLGYASLLLALLGIRRALQPTTRPQGVLLVFMGIFFSVLALGPFLVIDGISGWSVGQPVASITNWKLPYYWLADVFPFDATRATSRYSIMTTLTVALLLAFGCESLLARFSGKLARGFAGGAIFLVIAGEVWTATPRLLEPVPVSPFHQQLGQEPGQGSILQLPFQINGYRYPYYSAAHRWKVIGGAVDKPYRRWERELLRYPFFRQLALLGTPIESMDRFRDIFLDPLSSLAPAALSALNTRYAVVHKNDEFILSFGPYRRPSAMADRVSLWISKWMEPIYEDDLVQVYQPKPVAGPWVYPVVGPEWGEAEQHQGYVSRPLRGESGSLRFRASGEGDLTLAFELTAVYRRHREVTLFWNGQSLKSMRVNQASGPEAWQKVELQMQLGPGEGELVIQSKEPALSGHEVYGNDDRRKISLVLRRVTTRFSPHTAH